MREVDSTHRGFPIALEWPDMPDNEARMARRADLNRWFDNLGLYQQVDYIMIQAPLKSNMNRYVTAYAFRDARVALQFKLTFSNWS